VSEEDLARMCAIRDALTECGMADVLDALADGDEAAAEAALEAAVREPQRRVRVRVADGGTAWEDEP
jgi:DNA-binding GntR family transcriptional regulator